MKPVTFIRERRSEREQIIDYFFVEDSIEDVEGAFRAAVAEYLKSPESKPDVEYACGDYNWGDAITTVPEEIFNRHGIHYAPDAIEIFVNQDEVLFPELQEAHFEEDDE